MVFHELIHVCSGNELDAEAFEEVLFPVALGAGASKPDLDDWMMFRRRNWKGRWVHLQEGNATTGIVNTYFGGRPLCSFSLALADSDFQAKQAILNSAPQSDL